MGPIGEGLADTDCYDAAVVTHIQPDPTSLLPAGAGTGTTGAPVLPGFVRRLGLALANPRFRMIAFGWSVLVTAVVFLPDPAGFAVDTHIYVGAYRNMTAGQAAYGVPYAMTADPTGTQTIQYFSTPAAAIVGGAIGALPQGDWWWLSVNVLATVLAFTVMCVAARSLLPGATRRQTIATSIVPVAGGLATWILFQPDIQQLVYGNQESLTLLAIAASAAGMVGSRRSLAGAGLGAAAVLKGWPALLLLPFAVQRRWRELAWALGVGTVGMALTLPLVGVRPWLDLLQATFGGLGRLAQGGYNMAPLATLVPSVPTPVWIVATIGAVAATGVLPLQRALPAAMRAYLLLWPVVWMHDGVMLLVGLTLLLAAERRLSPTLGLLYVLFAARVAVVWLPASLLLIVAAAVPERIVAAQDGVHRWLVGGRAAMPPAEQIPGDVRG